MKTELPKTYDPAAVESAAWKAWTEENLFHAEPSDPGEPYSIVIPPPNVTGALHLGHAINNTLQDILTRVHRMRGFNTVWIPGLDHAGIATQAVVEKQLKEKENKTRHDVGREGLVERIWAWKQSFGDRIVNQLKRLGCSCDWQRERFTLDEQCARAVRETFFKLFKDGLVYRGKRLVNWDTHLQTSISDDEIYHETVKTSLWHIKYEIVSTRGTGFQPAQNAIEHGLKTLATENPVDHPSDLLTTDPQPRTTYMVVATTRPETLLGDTAVAIHSEDARWNWAIGESVKLPLTGRLIPIIADDILVNPEFGTGVVKVTPAHDPNDYDVYKRHLNQPDAIELINLMNPDGTLNEAAGERYKGLSMSAARKKVVEDLGDLLVKEEPYETQVGHSDRSKTPIQPYLSDQWFVKMAPLAEPALKVVEDGTIQFFPERHKQQYLSWLGEKRDWPISRQLWWGHRIPVWTFEFYVKDGEDKSAIAARYRSIVEKILVSHQRLDDALIHLVLDDESPRLECAARNLEAEAALDDALAVALERGPIGHPASEAVGGDGAWFEDRTQPEPFTRRDPDVLDTWFSSALWPHSTLGWPERTPDLAKWYPTSVLLTGRDIITLWVARMVMTGMYNMGHAETGETQPPSPLYSGERDRGRGALREPDSLSKREVAAGSSPSPSVPLPLRTRGEGGYDLAKHLGIPFAHVVINPTILDGKGERMSKSKGNGVDPVDIIDTHGADALRFTLTGMATETQDVRLPVKKDAQGRNSSDKFDAGRNFCNKLWNASRFVLSSIETLWNESSASALGSRSLGSSSTDPSHSTQGASTPGVQSGRVDSTESLSLADRWIISRFASTLNDANHALATYRFDQYAKTCYDFFWRDFCDWYVEAVKPAMKDPARAAAAGNVLATLLDASLRLLHPIIPFITETIWWRLNDICPQRGLPGVLDCPPSARLIKAAWPKEVVSDAAAEQIFGRLQSIVVAIRNLRSEHKVDLKRAVTVSIALSDEKAVTTTNDNREIIELLATCSIKEMRAGLTPAADSISVSVNGDCTVYVEGLVNAEAEKLRSAKRIEELTRQIAAMKGRLGNAGYIAKAPPKLVEESKAQLAAAEAELAELSA